jgi:hypothetical protein
VHADGEVLDEAHTHTGSPQRGLDLAHLPGQQPLQPAVQVDLVGVLLAPPGDRLVVRVAQLVGQRSTGRPKVSASAHQVANATRPSPSSSTNLRYASARSPVSGTV